MKDFQDIYVSKKHLGLRIAGFVLALLAALAAFSLAVTGIGRKEAGYYQVETLPDEEALLYGNGIAFVYSCEGSSAEIRNTLNLLKNEYSAALKRAYILLDAEHTYEGYANLATLNQSIGQEIEVSEELYAVLANAMEKTEAGEGYNMFAGALYAEWNSILMLSDAERFDPLNDPEEAERIARLGELTSREAYFHLELVDETRHIVRLDVSEEYLAVLAEYELKPVVLDLNLLHDAYELQIVAAALEQAGCGNGYLTTDSGLTVSLSRHAQGSYCVYAPNDGDVTPAAAMPVTAGSACSQFQSFAFSEGDYGFYTVTADGTTYYRHPYLPSSGEYPNVLLYACVTVDTEDPVEAAYQTLRLYACEDRTAVDAIAAQPELTVAYGLQDGDGKIVYANEAGMERLTAATEYGFRLEAIDE